MIYLLVTISQTTKLLLSSSVPAVEPDFPTIREEVQRVNFNTNSCCIEQKIIQMNRSSKQANEPNKTKD